MDLFDGSDDSDGEEVPRPAACGVLQFHNGTESELLRVVAAEAQRGDANHTLAVIDRFCRSRHWMMHVGDVKGAILRAAAARAAPGLWVELGAYCGYSAVLLASQMQSGTLVSLDTEARCVAWSRQLVEHAGLAERVKVMQSSPAVHKSNCRDVSPPRLNHDLHAIDAALVDLRTGRRTRPRPKLSREKSRARASSSSSSTTRRTDISPTSWRSSPTALKDASSSRTTCSASTVARA